MNDNDQWWLATLGRTLVWARLRVLDAGTAEVLDSDGITQPYDSEDTARAALMDAEFVALDGLDDDDARDRGFALDELAPPQRRGRRSAARADGAAAAAAALSTGQIMYLPRAFAETDLPRSTRCSRPRPLRHPGHRRTTAMPTVSHLPVLYRRDGDRVELIGHWARPNPQARHAGPALAIFHGPHAYVSPGWYPDKEEAARVPTWNYAVAHLHGTLETFDDEASLADLVDGLSREHEASVGSDWRFEFERDDHRSQLRGIVGFRFVAERIELKFKLSQNHPLANRECRRRAPGAAARAKPAATSPR